MWIVRLALRRPYMFRNLNNERNNDETKKTAEKVVVPSESKGIVAAFAKLMRRRSVIDIVERFQKRHALQEEREMGSAVAVPGGTWPGRARPSLIQLTK